MINTGKIFIGLFIFCTALRLVSSEVKILSLCAVVNDILIRSGQVDKLTAIDQFGRIVPGTDKIPVIGRGATVSFEKIIELEITHVIAWEYQRYLNLPKGVETVLIPTVRMDNYPEIVKKICALAGVPRIAETLIDEFREKTRLESSTDKQPKVYVELYSPFKTAGKDSYINDLIQLAGGDNIAGGMKLSGSINIEQVIQKNPEIIIFIHGFGSKKEIANRPGFKSLPAVRNNRIYAMERKYFTAGLDPGGAVAILKNCFKGEY